MQSDTHFCPIAAGCDVIADRWTPLILRELVVGATRFNDIERGLQNISRTLLTQRLRRLEEAGLCERRVTEAGHPEYLLTHKGRELQPILWSIGDWAMRWTSADSHQCTSRFEKHRRPAAVAPPSEPGAQWASCR